MNTTVYPRQGPMFEPPHPGKVIRMSYIDDAGITVTAMAEALGVSQSSLSRVLSGQARISPDMAIRLEKSLNTSAGTWLRMQAAYDEWQARNTVDLSHTRPLNLQVA